MTETSSRRPPRRLMIGLLAMLWVLLAIMVVTYLRWQNVRTDVANIAHAESLPVLSDAPDFSLTNRDGREISTLDLIGQPWVADFVFTRCPGVCPVLSRRMQELIEETPSQNVSWVSISVDPEHDTPPVLEAYAQKHGAPDNWLFLTGSSEAIASVVRDGFKLVFDPSPQAEGSEAIVHSNRFVLIDAEGRVRGYYDAFDAEALAALRRDLASLIG